MKLMYKWLLGVGLIACASLHAASLEGKISGTEQLQLYYISNFLFNEKTVVGQCKVEDDGSFRFEFETDVLRTYYIDLGKRKAQIIIAPNAHLALDLPDYTPLRKADFLNPYFKQELILLFDENAHGLNYGQMRIEQASVRYFKHVIESKTPHYTAALILDSMKMMRSTFEHNYLRDYSKYSEAIFYQLAHPSNPKAIKQHYLRNAAPDLQNTAFTKLVSEHYHNPFLAPDGLFYQAVSEVIMDSTLSENFISTIGHILRLKNREMAELIAVKGFFDAARFAPDYQGIITLLMQQLEAHISSPAIKQLCASSRRKIERLTPGNPAPYYALATLSGKPTATALKRRHVLLAFINTNIFECQKQLRLLEKYKALFKRKLEVVVVPVYQDQQEVERFLQRNTYHDITFTLWQENEVLLNDYNVKVLPAYFLIGSDGRLIYAPLSSPEETMLEELQKVFGE